MIKGRNYTFQVENKYHKPSAAHVFYQIGKPTLRTPLLLALFAQIISEPCFNFLRTEEQLGYIVGSGLVVKNGDMGVAVIVQSNKDIQFVENKIDEFMDSMHVSSST